MAGRIPQYSFHVTVEGTADGKSHLKGEITRAGVPQTWMDLVPLYAISVTKLFVWEYLA
jgi:hypothetical protein